MAAEIAARNQAQKKAAPSHPKPRSRPQPRKENLVQGRDELRRKLNIYLATRDTPQETCRSAPSKGDKWNVAVTQQEKPALGRRRVLALKYQL